ncbi:MAG: HEPN domain-containing protein [Paludibacteraceae bacterium]|nr:HEPN domain-containing protein [Paludibacteraceae bacterium]
MTREELVAYWFDIADYDFGTAQDLLKSGRWLYVGFMCHQVIEKTLKGYWCAVRDDEPPYIHNLAQLAIRSNLYESMSQEQKAFIARLMPMNIEARYPEYKKSIAKSLTKDSSVQIIDYTKSLQQWIKDRL